MKEKMIKYLDEKLKKLDDELDRLRKIEAIRALKEQEEKYKNQLNGAFWQCSEMIYDIKKILESKEV